MGLPLRHLAFVIACTTLLGCPGGLAAQIGYGNDALPSAEVTAFQRLDARLKYRDARITYDARNCALYEGRRPGGRLRRHVLRDGRGRPICAGQR